LELLDLRTAGADVAEDDDHMPRIEQADVRPGYANTLCFARADSVPR